MNFKHRSFSLDAFPSALDDLERAFARRRRKANLIFLLVASAAIGTYLALLPAYAQMFMVPVLVTGFAFVFWLTSRQKLGRAAEKVRFVRELFEEVRDDLHPRSRVGIDFDLRHYDLKAKLLHTARSVAGNYKYYYSDKWLHLRLRLVDGTALRIVRQAGVKKKKGSVVKEKRRLLLEVRPSPRMYPQGALRMDGPDAHRLRALLQDGCKAFHNAPEEFRWRASTDGSTLSLRVTQEDAPILGREVVVLVEHTLRFLGMLKARPALGAS